MTKNLRLALMLTAIGALTACGGGGGGGGSDGSGDPERAAAITNEMQAQKVVSRVVVGSTRYDSLNADLVLEAFELIYSLPEGQLSGSAVCDEGIGSLTYKLVDADKNNRMSRNDYADFNLSGCKVGEYHPLSGDIRLTLTALDDIVDLYEGTGGGTLGVRMTYENVTQPAVSLTMNGSYSLTLSKSSASSPLTITTRFPQLQVSNGDISASFDDFLFKQTESATESAVVDISGEAVVTVADLGELGYELDLVKQGDGELVGGQVLMTNAEHTLLVSFEPLDAISIDVDNGKDGSVEYSISTTLAELEALFATP